MSCRLPLLCLALAWTATASATGDHRRQAPGARRPPSPKVELSIQPGEARPGDPVAVRVRGAAGTPKGTLGELPLVFFPYLDGHLALASLPMETPLGSIDVTIFPSRAHPADRRDAAGRGSGVAHAGAHRLQAVHGEALRGSQEAHPRGPAGLREGHEAPPGEAPIQGVLRRPPRRGLHRLLRRSTPLQRQAEEPALRPGSRRRHRSADPRLQRRRRGPGAGLLGEREHA